MHTRMAWMLCGQKFLCSSTSSLSMLRESLHCKTFALLSMSYNSAGAFCIIKDIESPLLWKTLLLAELVPCECCHPARRVWEEEMFSTSQLWVLLFEDQKGGVAICKEVLWGNNMKEGTEGINCVHFYILFFFNIGSLDTYRCLFLSFAAFAAGMTS